MSGTGDGGPTNRSDEEIVERVCGGETAEFAILVDRYQRQVISLGYRFFRRREEAEDFAQEVFLQAFRRLSTFRATGRFYSWLMRIAYTWATRVLRRRADYEALGEKPIPDPAPRPDEAFDRAESRRLVVDAIRTLPRRYADCIGLYYFFELSYQEVSDVTGHPLNTVRSHIRRAKRLLAERLDDAFGPGLPSANSPPRTGGSR
ncbi:MAG: RNA polymerase sigma factor [Spirochaetota bacterium]